MTPNLTPSTLNRVQRTSLKTRTYQMNVTVLTSKNNFYGKEIIVALRRAGITVSVVVVKNSISRKQKLFRSVARRLGLVDALKLSFIRTIDGAKQYYRIAKENQELLKDYSGFCQQVIFSNSTNHLETEHALKESKTDLLVLGHSGIVRKNILTIPKIGVLNGHPGILPFYRGIDCPHWALLNGDNNKIGATVHWVDEGIDTGRIIITKKHRINKTTTISILEEELYTLCSEMLASVVVQIASGKIPEGTPQHPEKGQQYFKMPYKDVRKLKSILQSYQKLEK